VFRGHVQSRNRTRQRCKSIAVEVRVLHGEHIRPAVDRSYAAVAGIQNGRVYEVVAMFQTTKKSVLGEVQFVLGVTLWQLGQLTRKDCEVRVGTVNVQGRISRSMDTPTAMRTIV